MHTIRPQMERIGSFIRLRHGQRNLHILLFSAVLLLGLFARTWEFRSLPPGLNPDEASSGVDAYSLLHYGVDRNGVSFPVFFVSWGGGQNALYAYILMPFIALGGLNPFMVRLPMLLSGLLTLPLVYFIGRRTINQNFGLISMFLLAISPWHILLSRWGLESNILPFIFSIGYLLLLKSLDNPRWFAPAMIMMGLCLYAYGTAYAAIPVFLACGWSILVWTKSISLKALFWGVLILAVVSAPIGLFLAINSRHWSSIHLGPVTIPQLPAKPRYETVGVVFGSNMMANIIVHLRELTWLLWTQLDGLISNSVSPYGYFYAYTFPVAALGAVLLIPWHNAKKNVERLLLLAWLAAGLALGILQQPDVNRINLIFIPLILCVAFVLLQISAHSKIGLSVAVVIFLVAFAFFNRDYHGQAYRSSADQAFFPGLLPAIDYAAQKGDNPICITDTVNMPYIYVLFSQHVNPWEYLQTVKYDRPHGALREVLRFGRYSFGLDQCRKDRDPIYILAGERPPESNITYTVATFNGFTVYSPGSIAK